MSYERSYCATISGIVCTTVRYPASETSGSIDIELPWSELVSVDILVDTEPFDDSVHSLRRHVDVLTGSVVAIGAAQVAEKCESASRVAEAVTTGFMKLIRSEISQQTTGLRNRIESLLLKLNDMKSACLRVQETMQQDYSRITERYAKVFEELDQETKRRISMLDAHAISARAQIAEQAERASSSRLCTMATVNSAENSNAQMKVCAAAIRAQVQKLLQNASAYLAQESRITQDMQAMLVVAPAAQSAEASLPVLYMEADSPNGITSRIFAPNVQDSPLKNRDQQLGELFQQTGLPWLPMDEKNRSQVERFLMPSIDSIQSDHPQHDIRVRQGVMRIWQAQLPQALSYQKIDDMEEK